MCLRAVPPCNQADCHSQSLEGLRKSVDNCIAALRSTKKIDLFQSARVDRSRPVEEAIQNLVILKNEGKFDHIGMSECRAETLRRGNSVRSSSSRIRLNECTDYNLSKVYPISVVEIEISIWSYEEEVKKGELISKFTPLCPIIDIIAASRCDRR